MTRSNLPIPVPGGFRRRLAVAFLLVAASAGGLLAVTSYVLIRQYRHQTFQEHAREGAELSLLSTPDDVSLTDFEALVAEFRRRGGFETVALADGAVFSSDPALRLDDVPDDLVGPITPGGLVKSDATVDGEEHLVIGGVPRDQAVRLYFFFSKRALISSITELRNVLAVGWLVAVVAAALIGRRVARRTLRPVRAAAEASQSLAEGLLETRVTPSDDEFGLLGQAFNEMADALQAKMEQLEIAAARERQFTADVAHELRTPLAAMMSATALVEDGLDDLAPDLRRPVQLLLRDVRRLQGLVLELLELSRLDAGSETQNLEPLRLKDAVDAVVSSCDPEGGIEVDVADDLYVIADRARFRRVLGNLVDNALRHGSPPVAVEGCGQGDAVAIRVLDRGPGVGGGDTERLFHRFYKADAARTRDGAGLGLAIALQNAKLQDGDISATDRDGGGACFTLVLRRATRDSRTDPPHPSASRTALGSGRADDRAVDDANPSAADLGQARRL